LKKKQKRARPPQSRRKKTWRTLERSARIKDEEYNNRLRNELQHRRRKAILQQAEEDILGRRLGTSLSSFFQEKPYAQKEDPLRESGSSAEGVA